MKHAVLGALALALTACPKEEAAPEDRLIQKLKAEKERLGNQAPTRMPVAAPQEPAANPLAEQVVGDDRPRVLQSPQKSTFQVGDTTLRIQSLETSRSVKGDRVGLTSSDTFLKVALSAVSSKPDTLAFRGATLSNGTDTWKIAPDAQRVVGTHGEQLQVGAEKKDLVLYFELPPEAVKAGLKLVWPGSTGTPIEVQLQ